TEAVLAGVEDAVKSHRNAPLGYGPAEGVAQLRAALVEYFAEQDIDASGDRLLVTTGAMQALDMLFRLFLDPGDLVTVERTTYPDLLVSPSTYQVEISELAVDAEGAQVDQLPDLIERGGRTPKVIYVMPTFHNPTGISMARERRDRLVELARRYGAVLIEDDP